MHILFSLPVHENNELIRLTIANAQQHTKTCTIVLHVSDQFKGFDETIADIPGVLINPKRYITKHGFSFLNLHVTNYAHAAACGVPFKVFCTLHTSEMFVKRGVEKHIAKHPYSLWYDRKLMPQGLDWHPMNCVRRFGVFNDTLPDESWYLGGIVEGTWMSRDIMSKIYAWATDRIWVLRENDADWAVEEIVLPTMANWFGGDQACGEPYNAYFHDPSTMSSITVSDIDDVIAGRPVKLWSANFFNNGGIDWMSDGATKYSVKRLPNDINDPLRQHIIRLTGLDLHAILGQ